MKKPRIIVLVSSITLVFLICFISYNFIALVKSRQEDLPLMTEAELPQEIVASLASLVNNEEDKDELISKTYTDTEVKFVFPQHPDTDSFKEINKEYPIECLRKVGAYYYSIHKTSDGGYAYILFEYSKEHEELRNADFAIVYKLLSRDDFSGIKAKKSTLEDVAKIDPDVAQNLGGTGGTTLHNLSDGSSLKIHYKNKKNL